jgi:hypothetical protein
MTILDKIEAGEPVEAQELFDYITSKVLEQGRASIAIVEEPSGETRKVCVYRGQDGIKCAAGHVIPDAWYSDRLEGHSIDAFLDMEPRIQASLGSHMFLLSDLQEAHDNAYRATFLYDDTPFTKAFIQRAIAVAKVYHLNHALED